METQIRKWNYGHYSSSNYGANSMAISVGDFVVWFSCDTVVAFKAPGHLLNCCENLWGTITGKHLNWIQPDKKQRTPQKDFDRQLQNCLQKHNLILS